MSCSEGSCNDEWANVRGSTVFASCFNVPLFANLTSPSMPSTSRSSSSFSTSRGPTSTPTSPSSSPPSLRTPSSSSSWSSSSLASSSSSSLCASPSAGSLCSYPRSSSLSAGFSFLFSGNYFELLPDTSPPLLRLPRRFRFLAEGRGSFIRQFRHFTTTLSINVDGAIDVVLHEAQNLGYHLGFLACSWTIFLVTQVDERDQISWPPSWPSHRWDWSWLII